MHSICFRLMIKMRSRACERAHARESETAGEAKTAEAKRAKRRQDVGFEIFDRFEIRCSPFYSSSSLSRYSISSKYLTSATTSLSRPSRSARRSVATYAAPRATKAAESLTIRFISFFDLCSRATNSFFLLVRA